MLVELAASWNSYFLSLLAYIGSFHTFSHNTQEGDVPGWAFVSEVKGAVRHKRSYSSLWNRSSVGTKLYPGDKMFVEADSEVMLRYPALHASLYCSSPSMFTIDKNLANMRFKDKLFALSGKLDSSDNKKDPKAKPTPPPSKPDRNDFLQLIERPGDKGDLKVEPSAENKDEADKKLEQISFGLTDDEKSGRSTFLKFDTGVFSMVRQVHLLEWVFPRGTYDFVAAKFPSHMSAEVVNAPDNPVLYAYLWSELELTPKWSGVSRGKFRNVVIPEPGNYRMQIFSEDDSAVSDVVYVNASTAGQAKSRLIPETWEDGRARWVDE